MTAALQFDLSHPGPYGQAIRLSPLVRRVVANNPGPLTFTGTVTHLVGRGDVAVIDPGPDDGDHLAAIIEAAAGETISHIVITHAHRDHTDGAQALHEATGAPIVGSASSCDERSDAIGGIDAGYRPHRELMDGDIVQGQGWTLQAIATPGHTGTHLAFALLEEKALFSGDHVMAWSTTLVSPPDGSMSDYKASLLKLMSRDDTIYYPGHGPALRDPLPYVGALLQHRLDREAQILTALRNDGSTVRDIVRAVYPSIGPALLPAAERSVLSHVDELLTRGIIRTEAPPGSTLRIFRR